MAKKPKKPKKDQTRKGSKRTTKKAQVSSKAKPGRAPRAVERNVPAIAGRATPMVVAAPIATAPKVAPKPAPVSPVAKAPPRAPERVRFDASTSADRRALIIVDLQNDFCSGGALAVPEGDDVVGPVNALVETFRGTGDRIYATREWLPAGTRHFKENGGRWPVHCVEETKGAGFHSGMRLPWDATIVTKGKDGEEDTYSGFLGKTPDGRSLLAELRLRGVASLVVGGLATEFSVRATVLDGLKNGFKVTVVKGAVRPVDLETGAGEAALVEMKKAGAKII